MSTTWTAVGSTSPSSGASGLLIGGGVYAETCVTPARIALFGSGGRAAMVAADLGGVVVLHTFHPEALRDDIEANFNPAGIRVIVHPSPHRLCFEYLHPMARPRITPFPAGRAITVPLEGEQVLRFGCIEGDFRVAAARAVYDPQSGSDPAPFGANGSTAGSLAMILNANELRGMAGTDDLGHAATYVMRDAASTVLVVKDGPAGAYVFEGPGSPRYVPAYPTDSVYKIGSGDVFSATFAHAWMSHRAEAAEAADRASRRTAQYVEAPVFPLPSKLPNRVPRRTDARGRRVLLAVDGGTASRRWVREEAVRGLRDLGATVVPGDGCFPRDRGPVPAAVDRATFDVVLAHADDRRTAAAVLRAALALGKPVVVFADDPAALEAARKLGIPGSADLCSALYQTQWVPL